MPPASRRSLHQRREARGRVERRGTRQDPDTVGEELTTGSEPVRLLLTEAPAAADVALIEDELSAFNATARGTLDDRRALCVLATAEDGRSLGGLTAYTRWNWLHLDCFWLPEALRRQGWGEQVLAEAEAEARRRGCTKARLFTYSFQAQGFYERHGYVAYATLEDDPPGHSTIFLRKDLGG